MHFTRITGLIFTVLAGLSNNGVAAFEPKAPAISFLYRAYVVCAPSIYETEGPYGIRKAIPIIGGNFTGPRLRGKILDLGADWGATDPQTGIFSADTRYNLQTHDGANLFLQTTGAKQDSGDLHLKIKIETGDKDYYWLNNIVAFGILHNVDENEQNSTLRIDAWHMTNEYNSTTFINGTTYP